MLALSKIWITLGPLFVINAIFVTSYFCYHLYFSKKLKREYKGAKNEGSEMVSSTTREWWFWTTEPIVKMFVKLHMGPNAITMLGVFVTGISALLFAYGSFGYAGWIMVLGASFDFIDGRVARMMNSCSRSGAFLDSVTDRLSEGMVLLGIAITFRHSWMLIFVIAAMIGSTLVSYTRARGEALGVDCSVGWMQRPERITYLGMCAILDPVQQTLMGMWYPNPPHVLVIFAVVLIAVMTLVTSVHRMIYIMNVLDTEDQREKDSIPQIITKLSTQEGREEFWEKAKYGYDRTKTDISPVVLFHAGAIDRNIWSDLIAKGELPNISRHLVERGGMYDAICSFPSTTGLAAAPLVTGCFPGTCDIPGVRWFDRNVPDGKVLTLNRFRDYLGWGAYAMDHDLSKSVRTIFEYSRQAANIFGMLNRGCGFVRDPAFFRMHSNFHSASNPHDLKEADELAFHWFANAIKRETDFVFYSFPPLALVSPANSSEDTVRYAYKNMDGNVGKAIDHLKEKGMYDNAEFIFVADYCHGEKRNKFDLTKFLSERYRTTSISAKLKEWQFSDVISLPSGNSMSHIYVRNGDSWTKRTFFEGVERRGLVGSLLEKDQVDIIAGRSVEGGIVVQSKRGRAHIHEDADGRITYMTKGGDPFGFGEIPQVINYADALNSTIEGDYPDGIVSVLQLFRSGRTGDLVLSLADGCYLSDQIKGEALLGTSGSLLGAHVNVPLLSSTKLSSAPMRTADVFATVLQLMGIEARHDIDGVFVGADEEEQSPLGVSHLRDA